MNIGSIGKTIENFHMMARGYFVVENVKKGFVVKERCNEAIDKVSCNKNTLPPLSQILWANWIENEGLVQFQGDGGVCIRQLYFVWVCKHNNVDKLSHGHNKNCAWRKILPYC